MPVASNNNNDDVDEAKSGMPEASPTVERATMKDEQKTDKSPVECMQTLPGPVIECVCFPSAIACLSRRYLYLAFNAEYVHRRYRVMSF
jgi:hypothetical protein